MDDRRETFPLISVIPIKSSNNHNHATPFYKNLLVSLYAYDLQLSFLENKASFISFRLLKSIARASNSPRRERS